MSYYGSGGPNWPMIRAKQRAESEAAASSASAAGWKARFEALAAHVREAANQASVEHRQEGFCHCRSCWDAVIAGIVQETGGGGSATRDPSAAGGTFSFADLFGRSAPPGH